MFERSNLLAERAIMNLVNYLQTLCGRNYWGNKLYLAGDHGGEA
jgi:hypothetical protein